MYYIFGLINLTSCSKVLVDSSLHTRLVMVLNYLFDVHCCYSLIMNINLIILTYCCIHKKHYILKR